MNSGVKETSCTHCVHRQVCKHKEDYLNAVEAVFNASVYKSTNDGKASSRPVTCYDCIGDIFVSCKYHQEEQVLIREGIF